MNKTIIVKYGVMVVFNDKRPRARLMWQAPGLDVYVEGELKGIDHEIAADLAMNIAQEMHIPAGSLRSVNRKQARSIDTLTKRMF